MKRGKRKKTMILCVTLFFAGIVGNVPIPAAASEKGFSIQVEDDGRELPANQEYSGLICNIKDTYSEMMSVTASDGSVGREKVMTMNLNNIWVSVSGEGTRAYGVPIFSTDIQSSREREVKDKLHHVSGHDCPRLNDGIDAARKEIMDGYFQKPLERFLSGYPEIRPEKREYTLRLTGGGWTDREEDDTSYWELDYALTTLSEEGENITVATIDITRVVKAQGFSVTDDAHYRIWSAENGMWRLMEDPADDLGRVWVSQIQGEDFCQEDEVQAYVEGKGAGFDCLLPAGADPDVEWECRKVNGRWYDFLVWKGNTSLYELTLAIPLMDEGAGGWYLASRIRKEAADKETCEHILSVMMQTFRAEEYVHRVREGESLWSIYKAYGGQDTGYEFSQFIKDSGAGNPGLIYEGQYLEIPWQNR